MGGHGRCKLNHTYRRCTNQASDGYIYPRSELPPSSAEARYVLVTKFGWARRVLQDQVAVGSLRLEFAYKNIESKLTTTTHGVQPRSSDGSPHHV
jgi:hypothetical protein